MQSFEGKTIQEKQQIAEDCKAPWLVFAPCYFTMRPNDFLATGLATMIAQKAVITQISALKVHQPFFCRVCVSEASDVCNAGWTEAGGGFCEASADHHSDCASSYDFAEVGLAPAPREQGFVFAYHFSDGCEN